MAVRRYVLTTPNTHWVWSNICELIGYNAWIDDTNGNEIDEKTLNMAIAGDADNALDQV